MAIAPLEEPLASKRPATTGLRVLEGGRPSAAPARGAAVHARREPTAMLERSRAAHPSARPRPLEVWRPEADLSEARLAALALARQARQVRAQTLARRRRTGLVVVCVVAVGLLAMPLRALGAVTVDGRATPGGAVAGLAPGSAYVVAPGDTVSGLAERINPAQARTIARELVDETGSVHLVPGERVVVP